MSTHALASITATYTDSEPEGEEEDGILQEEREEREDREDREEREEPGRRPPSPPPIQVSLEPSSRVAQLVSYHDDTALTDEEGDGEGEAEGGGGPGAADGVELPPEPSGRCSPRLLDKVAKLHERLHTGLDMNNTIQSRKEFRNPSIYEKLIQFCNLNELGTNYPARTYDPLKWGKESFYEELARVQKVEMDKREKEKKERTKVEFVSGMKKGMGSTEEELKKRKSKWDQVGAGATGGGAGLLGVRLLPPSLTTAATGTKSTVISAFGSLPKKPKM